MFRVQGEPRRREEVSPLEDSGREAKEEGERMSDGVRAWYESCLKQTDEREAQAPNEEERHVWKMFKLLLREIDPSDPNFVLSLIKRFAGFILDLELKGQTDLANYLKEELVKVCANNL